MAERAWEELGALMGVGGSPLEARRGALSPTPSRSTGCTTCCATAGVEAALARLGGVAVAGAAYHGVGIPACIASGRAAAHALL